MSDARPSDRVVFGPVAAVRPWLFAKALYLILAFDLWHTLVGPAWRYGTAGFNVAHFPILDALPIPTTQAYVGMLVAVGTMSFTAALLPRVPRLLSIAILVLYTWGWSCSMLDSYQHHYLLSAVLFAACLFPRLGSMDVLGLADAPASATPAPSAASGAKKGKKKREVAPAVLAGPSPGPARLVTRVRSVGWSMLVVFSGIVYTFTAISKTEPEWFSGEALRDITQNGATMRAPMELASDLGLDADTVFRLLGSGMVALQAVIALGYVTAMLRDGRPTSEEHASMRSAFVALAADRTRAVIGGVVSVLLAIAVGVSFSWLAAAGLFAVGFAFGMPPSFHRFAFAPTGRPRVLSVLASLALVLALSFHTGAEYIGLQIGWFSYYMLALALAALAPAHWLVAAASAVTAPWRTREPGLLSTTPLLGPVLGMIAAAAAAYAGVEIDLPGAYSAALAVGIVGLGIGLLALARPEKRAVFARASGSLAIAMLACWLTMTSGTERYDFYRFAGGDFRRRHEYRAALDAYREANRYAPEGESREDRVREMEEAVRREGGTP